MGARNEFIKLKPLAKHYFDAGDIVLLASNGSSVNPEMDNVSRQYSMESKAARLRPDDAEADGGRLYIAKSCAHTTRQKG